MAVSFQLGYYPWITQHVEQDKIKRDVTIFATAFQKELQQDLSGAAVSVTDPIDVAPQVERIIANTRCIELMNPLGFVFGRLKSRDLEAVAVAQRIIDGKVGVTYFAQLYAHVDSGVTSLEQAAGKSVGYGVSFSTSNFLVPAQELQKKGIHPFCGFTRIEFVGGHDKVAKAVYNKQIVLGAGHDGVIIDLSNQPGFGDAQAKLKTLLRSPPIPSDPVVVNIPDAGERKAVAAALVRAGATPEGKQALSDFWGKVQGLEATTSDKYDGIEAAIKDLGFRPADLFPKP
jgi:phosphonate transport system substrate-binding protein